MSAQGISRSYFFFHGLALSALFWPKEQGVPGTQTQMIILVTGGARSGKSLIAETRTLSLGPRVSYIATAQAFDAEMAARIADHQARRGAEWTTHAAPLDVIGALKATDGQGPRQIGRALCRERVCLAV